MYDALVFVTKYDNAKAENTTHRAKVPLGLPTKVHPVEIT